MLPFFLTKIIYKEKEDPDKYVPNEILKDKYQNTHIQKGEPTIYEKDKMTFKKYECGCEFGRSKKGFGFSNHWCDQHAPTTYYNASGGIDHMLVKEKSATELINKHVNTTASLGDETGLVEVKYADVKSGNHKSTCEDYSCNGCFSWS